MRKRSIAAWLCGIALVGTCFAGSRSFRDELKETTAQSGLSLAEFDRGKLSRWGLPNGGEDTEIPFAMGHSWSYEGMLSPDGTLAAFPYWEVDPCPSLKTCDPEADRHFFLAIVRTDGSGITEYPRIVLPSEMCWTRDNSKLAMVIGEYPSAAVGRSSSGLRQSGPRRRWGYRRGNSAMLVARWKAAGIFRRQKKVRRAGSDSCSGYHNAGIPRSTSRRTRLRRRYPMRKPLPDVVPGW